MADLDCGSIGKPDNTVMVIVDSDLIIIKCFQFTQIEMAKSS